MMVMVMIGDKIVGGATLALYEFTEILVQTKQQKIPINIYMKLLFSKCLISECPL